MHETQPLPLLRLSVVIPHLNDVLHQVLELRPLLFLQRLLREQRRRQNLRGVVGGYRRIVCCGFR